MVPQRVSAYSNLSPFETYDRRGGVLFRFILRESKL